MAMPSAVAGDVGEGVAAIPCHNVAQHFALREEPLRVVAHRLCQPLRVAPARLRDAREALLECGLDLGGGERHVLAGR